MQTPSSLSLRRRSLLKTAAAIGSAAWFPVVRAQTDTIRIGLPIPLTGPFTNEARAVQQGAALAVKEFNDAGGMNGRQAELLIRDDKLSAQEAVTRTIELIEKDRAHFIVGSVSSSVQLAVNNVTKQRKILYNSVSQSDTINESTDWSKYTFHECLNPHMTAGAVARHVFARSGKRVVYLSADYAYGHEMRRGFQVAGQAFGIDMLADILHPLGQTDFSSYFPRILSLNPDVLIVCNFGRDQSITFRQADDFGIKQKMQVVAPLMIHSGRQIDGHDVYANVIAGTGYYWGLEDTLPSARKFNDAFRAANGGVAPTDYAGLGYAGVRNVLAAANTANSTDSDKVSDALRAIKGDLYKGPTYYRACDHQCVQSVLIVESKPPAQAANKDDIFRILATEAPDESRLRSCTALGHG